MRTTFSIAFYCRQSKANKHGLSPLELSITVNGKRLFLNLPQKFNPEEFNRKRKPDLIQSIENEYRTKANEVVLDIMRNDLPLTVHTLREYMRTGGIKSMTLEELWKEHLNILQKRIGISIKEEVYQKYILTRNIMFDELTPTKEITTITNGDMISLYDTLKQRYKISTAAGYMTKVKTVITYAFNNGYIKTNPCNLIKIEKGRPTKEYLTEEELTRIEEADLEGNNHLEKARDILLFDAYGGGMAYCDLMTFNSNKLIKQGDIYTYTAKRKKTGIEFTTVLLPKAIRILERYNYTIPHISNQRLNSYAKAIGILSGIKKNLHVHLFRKSYATLLIQHHVPLSTISRCMGHSNTNITARIYAFIEEKTIANEVKTCFFK